MTTSQRASAAVRGLLAVVLATLVGFAIYAPTSTTATSAAAYTYDVPAIPRVGVHDFDAADATSILLRSALEVSASPSVEARGTSTTPSTTLVATEAERLAGRVDDFHGALDPIAQNSRTTSVMSTREGVDIISSGGRDLSPAQRALAQDGDVLGRMPGAHAEVTSLDAATKTGLSPSQIAVSRPICAGCQIAIQNSGGQILPGGMGAVWPR